MVFFVATAWKNLATRRNIIFRPKYQRFRDSAQNIGYRLNPNTTNAQKNLVSLFCRAPLKEKRQVVVWHDIINNSINSHRTNSYRASTAKEFAEILKSLTTISAIMYYQRSGTADIRNQLISSAVLVIPFTRCLISKRKRSTELVNENQALHQDVQLKYLQILLEHQVNLPAVLSKLPSNTQKNRKREGGRRKEDWLTEARKLLGRRLGLVRDSAFKYVKFINCHQRVKLRRVRLENDIVFNFLRLRVHENGVFLNQVIHIFKTKLLRTEINKARTDEKNVEVKL